MAVSDESSIKIVEDNSSITVIGNGMLTFINGTEFGKSLMQASLSADNVTVDLRKVDFIDTQIVQDLGQAAVKMINRGKRLKVIVSATGYPMKVMEISGYKIIMDILVENEN